MSRVYRFHGPPGLSVTGGPTLLRKRKREVAEQFHLIGADQWSICDHHGRRAIETYSVPGTGAVTLTRREADLIALANPGLEPPTALEDMHPWLPESRFLNDSSASLRAAESLIRRFGRHLVSPSSFCDEKWNTVCNALRQRSAHDARFHSAWHLPIQEAHVLEETRRDRSVVAIDFNGMYPSCMQHEFPKPSALQLIKFARDFEPGERLAAGLYRCVLREPSSDFITRYNPFRGFHSGRHLRARLDEPVAIDLNEFELAFFSRHFRRIHLVDAVVAPETIRHPLAREARRSFARRQNYREQGNKALADREKFLSTLMTSCASRPSRLRQTFATRMEALQHLRAQYGIDIPSDEPEAATDIWLDGRKRVSMRPTEGGVEVRGPALLNGSACHLLGQRIVARGRIVLLEMMERVLASAPDVQICYTNIDSIHFSLPTIYRDRVVAWLEQEAADAMGSFKIEAVTRHGLWLEPGRYWLHSGTAIDKFRNRSVGDRQRPFKDYAIHVVSRRIAELHVPVRITLDMVGTMSAARSVGFVGDDELARQRLIEIGEGTSFWDVLSELEHNRRSAIPQRMKAFTDLQDRIGPTPNATSLREEPVVVM